MGITKLSFLFFLLMMLLALSFSNATNDEAYALLQFKLSSIDSDTKGYLQDWNDSSNSSTSSNSNSPCAWTGIACSPVNGQVRSLNLSNMGLTGHLRLNSLLELSSLSDIDLHGNFFYGNLSYNSSATHTVCNFERVDLSANNFSGVIPSEFLANCPQLIHLNLSKNSIVGGIFPFADSVQELDLSNNHISDHGLLNYSLSSCGSLSYLNMSANKLDGQLGSLSFCNKLAILDLSYNGISGEIPEDFIFNSPIFLQQLDLSNNNFSGDFSHFNFGGCGNIRILDLSYNKLNGTKLLKSLGNCRQLESLDLSGNKFAGEIPAFLKNLSNLKQLSLANNQFSGKIPPELGLGCPSLVELNLATNSLTGGLPSSFTSCLSLQILDLGNNQLSGDFVEKVVNTLPSLRSIRICLNNISGPVPLTALMNCSLLEIIDLGSNQFSGKIPTGLCSLLPNLQKIILPNNYLSGPFPSDLGNCSNLHTLDLSFNYLSDTIPSEVWSLPKLVNLISWANNISGEIPENLCEESTSLQTLILSYNKISGSIPSSLTKCVNLIWISLSGNLLTGNIPSGVGNLQSLAILQLGSNSLSGQIPHELGNCRNLIWLDLNNNNLSGPVPPALASQDGLIVPGIVSGKHFAFLRNEAGSICPGAGVLFEFEDIRTDRLANFSAVHSCPATRIYIGTTVYSFASNGSMIYLDLSYNSLTGTLPEDFGSMSYLQVLNLGHNALTGTIPEAFGGLKMIGVLDLSHNHLTGGIPGELGTLTFLSDLDVSNNNLSGPIPSTGQLTTFLASRYENNSGLCGLPLPPCGASVKNHNFHVDSEQRRRINESLLIGIVLTILILFTLLIVMCKMMKNQKFKKQNSNYLESPSVSGASSFKLSGILEPLSINVATFEKPLRKLTFAHLLEATNGFSADSLIGSGGFGDVYKAQLKDGSIVAIKKLINDMTSQGDREFTAEMETIGKIKHHNLVPLLGYCKFGDERLLVYAYMKFGSLDMILHDNSNASSPKLDWSARKKIAIGAARGLTFLHHSCIPHIIHRDMKSSNVLIDENMEARVSDFGMARLVNALDSHLSVSTLAGTPGYVPPEYYQSFQCTTKGDVYSYGVILLELLSGKKPIDPFNFGNNNLVGWVKQLLDENRRGEIFDTELIQDKSVEDELYHYLKIACDCVDDRPFRRPTMIQVMSMFKEIQVDTDSDFLDSDH